MLLADPEILLTRLARVIREAIEAGVDAVQIREKDLSDADLLLTAREAVAAAAGSSTRIVVNGRPEVAVASGAGGVHLGGAWLAVGRQWRGAGNAPANFLIGASCHSLEEVLTAEHAGADYVFWAGVRDTFEGGVWRSAGS